ncbi:MAG TPA: glycosyltransferase family 2 protein [Candidatus Methanoperedens sp.]|nr:glycosyltransferase family 2 protein [Candidatus Methanoperedens sp.]
MSTIIKDLTVAIVTYQRPKQLEKCLESLYRQSHHPQKVLIIDNCFHQEIKNLCHKYKKLQSTYYFIKKPSIPLARNQAIKKCHTKYLAFIDDDCILYKNWTISAYDFIKKHSKVAFVVGKTILLNKQSQIAKCQYDNYQKWFNLSHPLDTKNVIFNHQKIKNFRFDQKFKIFEDVDFNQQLKEYQFVSAYNPQMVVSHPENSSLFSSLKKSYIRGQFKAKITKKWGNFDNYQPSIFPLNFSITSILKIAFIIGYNKNFPRPITIINKNDSGANQQRSQAFFKFLTKHHHYVTTLDSHQEFQKVIASRRYLFIYGWRLLKYRLLKSYYTYHQLDIYPLLLIETMLLKSMILNRLLQKNKTTLAIVQYPEDMLIVTNQNRPYKTLYDSPTIFSSELEHSQVFSKNTINILKKYEKMVFQKSDYTSFHWYTYKKLAIRLGFKAEHSLCLNWGCQKQSSISVFKKPIKIIHLGKLNSYWVNPKMLSYISQHHQIDIFSYEKPDPTLYPKLDNYKSYLKNEDSISNYQLGLITLSQDKLRSEGFSAKHLLYLSYGLPVLCPEWRKDELLKKATIYYNEKNIDKQIKKYSQKKYWFSKHQESLKIYRNLDWNITLQPLLKIVPKHT